MKCYNFILKIILINFITLTSFGAVIRVPQAYAKIQLAIDAAQAGDIIAVAAGTYQEAVTLKDNVQLQGAGAGSTTIDGLGAGNVVTVPWNITSAVSGFTILNSVVNASSYGIYCNPNSNVAITDNVITSVGTGIMLAGHNNYPVLNNRICNNSRDGIILHVSTTLITNNFIYKNGWSGIISKNSPCKPKIYNNTLVENRRGIVYDFYATPEIENNIVVNSISEGVGDIRYATGIIYPYNDVFNNGTNYSRCSAGTGAISADPLFTNAATYDYTLQAGSTCINAGNPSSAFSDANGSRNDMGAYGGTNYFNGNKSTGDVLAPSAPANPAATNISFEEVSLSWSASTDNVRVQGYKILINGVWSVSSSTNSCTVKGLTSNTTYSFSVIAFDSTFNESVSSNSLSVTTRNLADVDTVAPTTPPSFTMAFRTTYGYDNQIRITWGTSTDNVGVTSYKIYHNEYVTSLNFDVHELILGNLEENKTYSVYMTALDAAGNESAPTQTLSLTTIVDVKAPTPPAITSATAISSSQIDIVWDSSANDNYSVAGYFVYRNNVKIGQIAGFFNRNFSDIGLNAGTAYNYTVTSYDTANLESVQSAAVSQTTQGTAQIMPPTGLAASSIADTSITLTWNANGETNLAGYRIYRGGTQIGTTTSTVRTYTNTGLTPGTAYSYQVRAYDTANNQSALSTAVSATTTNTAAPVVPTGLASSAIADTSVTLTWNANNTESDLAGYRIYRNGTQIGTTTSTVRT
ncbi:MAG: hypothetical protein ACD_79C01532G0001, partial [uncultured bacterium]